MPDLADELIGKNKKQNSFDEEEKEINGGLASPLASDESTRISLESIRQGRAGLNRHRQLLLNRLPERDTYASFPLNSIEDKDLAYLSAETGDEFALMRGKSEDILFHGDQLNCHIEKSETLMTLLKARKLTLEIHSHPDYDRIVPSIEDRRFLQEIGQKKSKIVSSYTGKIIEFSSNQFDDLLQ